MACQKHHWQIHKMTYKVRAKAKADKAAKLNKAAAASQPAHGLAEEQLDYIRIEALMAENMGGEHSIEECAWQLGEHPLVIGGGTSVRIGANKRVFVKGDVAKIYMEGKVRISSLWTAEDAGELDRKGPSRQVSKREGFGEGNAGQISRIRGISPRATPEERHGIT